jgi:hypothetical protein
MSAGGAALQQVCVRPLNPLLSAGLALAQNGKLLPHQGLYILCNSGLCDVLVYLAVQVADRDRSARGGVAAAYFGLYKGFSLVVRAT